MNTVKLRITALEDNCRKFAVVCLGVKVAVAFGRDSGAKVAYGAKMISGNIGSGGSRVNWHCFVEQGSIFEIEVDAEAYRQNKNRLKKWQVTEIADFSVNDTRSKAIENASNNLE